MLIGFPIIIIINHPFSGSWPWKPPFSTIRMAWETPPLSSPSSSRELNPWSAETLRDTAFQEMHSLTVTCSIRFHHKKSSSSIENPMEKTIENPMEKIHENSWTSLKIHRKLLKIDWKSMKSHWKSMFIMFHSMILPWLSHHSTNSHAFIRCLAIQPVSPCSPGRIKSRKYLAGPRGGNAWSKNVFIELIISDHSPHISRNIHVRKYPHVFVCKSFVSTNFH